MSRITEVRLSRLLEWQLSQLGRHIGSLVLTDAGNIRFFTECQKCKAQRAYFLNYLLSKCKRKGYVCNCEHEHARACKHGATNTTSPQHYLYDKWTRLSPKCEEWKEFSAFYAFVKTSIPDYTDSMRGLSFVRKDAQVPHSPDNTQIITKRQ